VRRPSRHLRAWKVGKNVDDIEQRQPVAAIARLVNANCGRYVVRLKKQTEVRTDSFVDRCAHIDHGGNVRGVARTHASHARVRKEERVGLAVVHNAARRSAPEVLECLYRRRGVWVWVNLPYDSGVLRE